MKAQNIVFMFIIACVSGSMSPKVTEVFIKNEYRKPIILNVDGREFTMPTGNILTVTSNWEGTKPKQMKIKVQGSPTYHSGIQDELQTIALEDQRVPTPQKAMIIIRDTNNILHFKYNTQFESFTPQRQAPPTPTQPISIFIQNNTGEIFTLFAKFTNNKQINVAVQPGNKVPVCSNCAATDMNMNMGNTIDAAYLQNPAQKKQIETLDRSIVGLFGRLQNNKKNIGTIVIVKNQAGNYMIKDLLEQ